MYKNLEVELLKRDKGKIEFADLIGMPYSTFNYKMNSGAFTTDEAFVIHHALDESLDIKYLFERQ